MTRLGEKQFLHEDQERFAVLSADRNPMHMDAVAARRLLTGRQVVHGIHVFLTALEYWGRTSDARVTAVGCTFANPVSVGDRVVFSQVEGDPGTVALEAAVDTLVCARISLRLAESGDAPAAAGASPEAEVTSMDSLSAPVDVPPETHVGRRYSLTVPVDAAAMAFPAASARLGAGAVAAAASLSYFVGMVCPGLHSIFSSFDLALPVVPVKSDHLILTVRRFDVRVRLFDVAFEGPVHGGVKAFQRPAPQAQPTPADLAAHVGGDEFASSVSLVVGGSRGLGELSAKLVAVGGGRVIVTYAAGREDAERIAGEVTASGRGACEARRFDVIADSPDSLGTLLQSLTSVYFFATPRIYRKKAGLFDPALYAEFCAFYIERFHDLCLALEAIPRERKVRVYFPSTVFVTDRPKGMTEYAMAKAAGEVLIEEMNKTFRNVEVVCTRLPRLETDQTSSVVKVKTTSNLDTLLPLVRDIERR